MPPTKPVFAPLSTLFALCAACFLGCESASVPEFVLGEEPDSLLGVVEVREALLGPSVESDAEHSHGEAEDEDEVQQGDGHIEDIHDEDSHEEDGRDEDGHEEDGHEEDGHEEDGNEEDGNEEDGNEEDGNEVDGNEVGEHTEHVEHDHEANENVGPAGPIDVAVVGQVGGLTNPWEKTEPNFPFVQGQAKFFLADAAEVAGHQAEGHHHAPGEECAFCAARAGDSTALLAVVQFNDKNGKIVRRDARQLFDLKGSETVVVRGKARIVEGGLLVVDADGLYVRR